jgi:hypothetical protein
MPEHDEIEQQQETMAQFLSKSIADRVVYFTPPDCGRSSNPSLSTVSTESLTTTSNLSSLEFEQARVRNEENRRLFVGVFFLQLLEQRYLIKRYPISKSFHYYDCVLPELPLDRVFHNNGRNSQRSVSL